MVICSSVFGPETDKKTVFEFSDAAAKIVKTKIAGGEGIIRDVVLGENEVRHFLKEGSDLIYHDYNKPVDEQFRISYPNYAYPNLAFVSLKNEPTQMPLFMR